MHIINSQDKRQSSGTFFCVLDCIIFSTIFREYEIVCFSNKQMAIPIFLTLWFRVNVSNFGVCYKYLITKLVVIKTIDTKFSSEPNKWCSFFCHIFLSITLESVDQILSLDCWVKGNKQSIRFVNHHWQKPLCFSLSKFCQSIDYKVWVLRVGSYRLLAYHLCDTKKATSWIVQKTHHYESLRMMKYNGRTKPCCAVACERGKVCACVCVCIVRCKCM